MADLLSITARYRELRNWDSEEIDELMKRKAEKRGMFEENIILEDIESKDT